MPFGFWVLGNTSALILTTAPTSESQMPFGFWVLGNLVTYSIAGVAMFSLKCLSAFGFWGTDQDYKASDSQKSKVSNAFRLLGSGEPIHWGKVSSGERGESQMPFGFWVLGNSLVKFAMTGKKLTCLKCLSAFGFWGTSLWGTGSVVQDSLSQMPFGFWVLGNLTAISSNVKTGPIRLKCLSAFGFWGTDVLIKHNIDKAKSQMPFGFWVLGNGDTIKLVTCQAYQSLKCLSAFGFWGTLPSHRRNEHANQVSNAFRLLGSGERCTKQAISKVATKSQMPFGFWVLGNSNGQMKIYLEVLAVSNAFRLLGSGEQHRKSLQPF